MALTFEAQLERHAGIGTWTFVTVPFRVEEAFGTRSRVPIKGRIDGHAFRGALMPQGDGHHIIVVKREIRDAIGKEAGDTVRLELEADADARILELPEQFVLALAKTKKAEEAFDRLSYSHRKEYVEWIASAKKAETQHRRIQKAIAMIVSGARLKGS